jgi:hypothetical protein
VATALAAGDPGLAPGIASSRSIGTDHQALACSGDYIRCDDDQPVELENALDLLQQALKETEVAIDGADDRGDRQRIGERFGSERHPELFRMAGHDGTNLVGAECPELLHEADARVELWVAG